MGKVLRNSIIRFGWVVSTMLAVTAIGAYAADAPASSDAWKYTASQQSAQTVDELDEIWIRGKRQAVVISDVEDDFFALYNKLNANDDYDILCGYMSLSRGSMIMVRACAPGFIAQYRTSYSSAYYSGGSNYGTASYGSGSGPVCYGNPEVVNGAAYFSEGCYGSGVANFTPPLPVSTPPPALVLMDRREAYVDNLLKVINGDRRLREKYDHLVGLYEAMRKSEGEYARVRAEKWARKKAARKAGKTMSRPHES